MSDIKELDLYGLLELTLDCTEQDIRSAYRKKALKCHPDKNPDDEKAAETFLLLSKALEVLLDKSARDAYDKVIKRKEEVKIRNSKLDSTRKKFKEDLERREKEAEDNRSNKYKGDKSEEEVLQEEIDRLRKEGSVRLQEEYKLMTEELNRTKKLQEDFNQNNPENYRLKIKWNKKAILDDFAGDVQTYNEEIINKIFSKYGKINILVISNKKQNSALLEYDNVESAKQAKKYELGFPKNPLHVSFLNTDLNDDSLKKTDSIFVNKTRTNKIDEINVDSVRETTSNLFPSVNHSNNVFLDAKSNNIFPSTNCSNILFPISKSSNISFSSMNSNKSTNLFPSSSNLFPSVNELNILSNVKSTVDLDYEEKVLNQMRKAQEKQ